MSELYHIITKLQNTPKTNDKLTILTTYKDNELLKEYIRVTLDPRINFYITEKTFPKSVTYGSGVNHLTIDMISKIVSVIANRELTGDAAKQYINNLLTWFEDTDQHLIRWMMLKDFRAKIGATLVNRVWPGLIFEQPYQRCSLPKDVNLSAWPWEEGVFSQVKADGMYAAISNNQIITRNGSVFPLDKFDEQFVNFMKQIPDGIELNGELVVQSGEFELCDRKTGNGILNSVLQGGDFPEGHFVSYYVWDYYNNEDISTYRERWEFLTNFIKTTSKEIQCWLFNPITNCKVYSLEEANEHLQSCLKRALEGTVLKHPHAVWKDGTSKYCVKYKVEAELDMRIIGFNEGTGKAKGSLGSMRCASECGSVLVDVGTGFNDKQRAEIWNNRASYLNKIVTIKANDILTREGSDTLSLFLPVFIETRNDKNEADDMNKIKSIFDNVKGIV